MRVNLTIFLYLYIYIYIQFHGFSSILYHNVNVLTFKNSLKLKSITALIYSHDKVEIFIPAEKITDLF